MKSLPIGFSDPTEKDAVYCHPEDCGKMFGVLNPPKIKVIGCHQIEIIVSSLIPRGELIGTGVMAKVFKDMEDAQR